MVQNTIIDEIRQIAYEIHKYLGAGFLEKVYENALAHRLQKKKIKAVQQSSIKVYDEDGFEIGYYVADIIVNNNIIIELKTAKNLTNEHYAQVINYMKATKIENALLINFGSEKFQIKSFVLSNEIKP